MTALPRFEFARSTPAKAANLAKNDGEVSRFSQISRGVSQISFSDALRLAGDAAEKVTRHCEVCDACSPRLFTSDAVDLVCSIGRRLRGEYRAARAAALTMANEGAAVRR